VSGQPKYIRCDYSGTAGRLWHNPVPTWHTSNPSSSHSKYYTKISPSQGTKKIMEVEEYISSDCDPGDLALVFQAHYERSGNHLEIRKNAAEKWYAYFSGENPSITLDDFAIKSSD